MIGRKKLTRCVFGRGVGEKPCERERGGKREGKRNPGEEGNRERVGSNETSICNMIKRRQYNNWIRRSQ